MYLLYSSITGGQGTSLLLPSCSLCCTEDGCWGCESSVTALLSYHSNAITPSLCTVCESPLETNIVWCICVFNVLVIYFTCWKSHDSSFLSFPFHSSSVLWESPCSSPWSFHRHTAPSGEVSSGERQNSSNCRSTGDTFFFSWKAWTWKTWRKGYRLHNNIH